MDFIMFMGHSKLPFKKTHWTVKLSSAKYQILVQEQNLDYRADSRFTPSQWETSLQSNAISHWLCTNLESALDYIDCCNLYLYMLTRLSQSHFWLTLNMLICFKDDKNIYWHSEKYLGFGLCQGYIRDLVFPNEASISSCPSQRAPFSGSLGRRGPTTTISGLNSEHWVC